MEFICVINGHQNMRTAVIRRESYGVHTPESGTVKAWVMSFNTILVITLRNAIVVFLFPKHGLFMIFYRRINFDGFAAKRFQFT